MKNIEQIIKSLLPVGPMDAFAVGMIDFKNNQFQVIEASVTEDELKLHETPSFYFDLASLTKPLTNSLSYFLKPEVFNQDMLLCLSHRGGLPSWGRLSKNEWKELILSYPIRESETLYSDFSALRVLLELSKLGIDQKELCSKIWDQETCYWTDLNSTAQTPQYGYVNKLPNYGKVHDPNALVIGEYCSHAGLFSTIKGLCQTLLNTNEKTNFIQLVKADLTKHQHRFSFGWDRVVNPQETLAGKGCGKFTFGHLGFTGTSIWIDPDMMKGHVILSNATKYHWYDKTNLNDMRRAIGEIFWTSH